MCKKEFLIKMFNVSKGISNIRRYSGDFTLKNENVLEHLGQVALFSLIIYNNFSKEERSVIDISKLLGKAISHDVPEVILGDIKSNAKNINQNFDIGIKQLENQSIKNLSEYIQEGYNLEYSLYSLWKSYELKESIEDYLVKLCDIFSLIYKIWEEVIIYNNYHFYRIVIDCESVLERDFKIKKLSFNSNKKAIDKSLIDSINEGIQSHIESCKTIIKDIKEVVEDSKNNYLKSPFFPSLKN